MDNSWSMPVTVNVALGLGAAGLLIVAAAWTGSKLASSSRDRAWPKFFVASIWALSLWVLVRALIANDPLCSVDPRSASNASLSWIRMAAAALDVACASFFGRILFSKPIPSTLVGFGLLCLVTGVAVVSFAPALLTECVPPVE